MDNINGKMVAYYRKLRGMTLDDLSKKADVSVTTISLIETGRNKTPSTRTVIKLANALDVNMVEFWSRLRINVVRD